MNYEPDTHQHINVLMSVLDNHLRNIDRLSERVDRLEADVFAVHGWVRLRGAWEVAPTLGSDFRLRSLDNPLRCVYLSPDLFTALFDPEWTTAPATEADSLTAAELAEAVEVWRRVKACHSTGDGWDVASTTTAGTSRFTTAAHLLAYLAGDAE